MTDAAYSAATEALRRFATGPSGDLANVSPSRAAALAVDAAMLAPDSTPKDHEARSPVTAPPELLDEIREDLRHEGTPRCDRWFPDLPSGTPVVKVDLSVGLAWWTIHLPIVSRAKVGDRILVLSSPNPKAVGKVGTLRSFDGFACVDLHDGTPVRPLVREVALLPAAVTP